MNRSKKILAVMLSALMLVSVITVFASATETAVTPRLGELLINESTDSVVNEAEGWEWNKETLTLTLNGVDFRKGSESGGYCIEFEELIDPDANYTVVFNGENTLNSWNSGIHGNWDTNITFRGAEDGVLNIVGYCLNNAIYGGHLVFESGTINLEGQIWGDDSVVVNGGTINIDTTNTPSDNGNDNGIITITGEIEINGGTYNFTTNPNGGNMALLAQNEDMTDSDLEYIRINGGDLTIENAYYGIGSLYRSVLINNGKNGSITFKNCRYYFYANHGDINIKSAKFIHDEGLTQEQIDAKLALLYNEANVNIADADYSRIDAALDAIPDDFRGASLKNILELIDARNSVVYGLNCFEQDKVDGYAEALEAVVAKILAEVPEEEPPVEDNPPAEDNPPVEDNPPADDEPVEEDNWFVRILKAIVNFFKTIFDFLFGWIGDLI